MSPARLVTCANIHSKPPETSTTGCPNSLNLAAALRKVSLAERYGLGHHTFVQCTLPLAGHGGAVFESYA